MSFFKRRQNKYGAQKQTVDGYSYMSKKEAAYAQELDLRIKAKDIKGYDRQVKVSMDIGRNHICNYYIDFVVHLNDGTDEWVEVKGMETDVWKLKWKLAHALYPQRNWILVK